MRAGFRRKGKEKGERFPKRVLALVLVNPPRIPKFRASLFEIFSSTLASNFRVDQGAFHEVICTEVKTSGDKIKRVNTLHTQRMNHSTVELEDKGVIYKDFGEGNNWDIQKY